MHKTQSNNLNILRTPHSPDWPVLRLLNSYRLIVVLALAAVYYLVGDQQALGHRSAAFFELTLIFYCTVILGFIYLEKLQWPQATTQFYLQNYIDVLCTVSLMYASGGVQSGLGPLLLINLALLSQLTNTRYALLFAAIAAATVLSAELVASTLFGRWAVDFERTALLAMLLFVVAWLMTVPLRRLMQREVAQPTKNRAALDAQEIATLNEEIIRELDSGVLVLNAQNQVVMINDTARTLLGSEFKSIPLHLGRLSIELMSNLEYSRNHPSNAVQAFSIEKTGQDVLPRFTPLSTGGVLIRIDDHSAIRQQFQQLKLASLGKLSASIAHEIRNPLSAISHAMQLLQESEQLEPIDAQLISIANNNTHRIDRIINDVLQLSNRQQVRRDTIELSNIIEAFKERFHDEHLSSNSDIEVNVEPNLFAIFDPDHLDQVLWNVCSNALLHNTDSNIKISINAFRSTPRVTIIDIFDNGRGIADLEREKLFEPFYSTHHNGCGLGLYIIRELCVLNKADIECLDCEQGAHFRLTLNHAQQMAA